jgi:quercetin dioxygenase-like cupin family protein
MPDTIPPLSVLKEQPLSTDIHLAGGLFIKHCIFAAGTYIPQHAHSFDHWSIIATGAVRVWKDGNKMGDYAAPAGIVIEAHAKHMFLALEPMTTVLCVHRVGEDGEPEIHAEHEIEGA